MAQPAERVRFYFVDVFATRPLTGNPLALVPHTDDLSEEVMRAVAREFNQSETTFLLRPWLPGADHRLRSFTPTGAEVGGAGHNALGAWLWLALSGALDVGTGADGRWAQEIGGEVLPVRVRREPDGTVTVSMDQAEPRFGAAVPDRSALAGALGLTGKDLVAGLPARVVDTGAAHLMVPVRDRAGVDRAAPDAARLAAELHAVGGEGCYLYSTENAGDGAAAYARFFNPVMGISEDPATGTAAGPLGALLVAEGVVAEGTLHVEQGHRLGRPSRITVTVTGGRVAVSGTGLVVADGHLSV